MSAALDACDRWIATADRVLDDPTFDPRPSPFQVVGVLSYDPQTDQLTEET